MTHHRIHLIILLFLLGGSLFVASPLFDLVLAVEEPRIFEREFSRIEIGKTIVFSEVVRTDEARRMGLSGREGLGMENGMLFVFQDYEYPSIWMKDMKFPIDIIWISGNQVVDFEENAQAPASTTPDFALQVYRPDTRANLVLEVSAGFVQENDIRIGDSLALTSNEEIEKALEKKILANKKEQLRFLRSVVAKEEFTIDSLRARQYKGGNFVIVKKIADNFAYTRYQISYTSDALTISGTMNVPKVGKPPYPIIILNHGYIDPEKYTIGSGSKREQDYFARYGYVTVHPDYRGHGESSPDVSARYDFNVGYTIDVMNLISAIKKFKSNTLDATRIGMWGHSMGGGITERVMVLSGDVKAIVLFAPISSDVRDNIYLVQGKITDIEKDYADTLNLGAFLKELSPYFYLSFVSAPIMIHHGTKDGIVPFAFSRLLNKTLLQRKKTSLLYAYENERHEFIKAWPLAMTRSISFFNQFVKNTKYKK